TRSEAPEASPSRMPARMAPAWRNVTKRMSGDAVAVDDGAVDLDAEAGAGRNLHPPALLHDGLFREMVAERVLALLEFQQRLIGEEAGRLVRRRAEEVQGGGDAHRRAPGMGYAFDPMGRGEGRDLLALGEPARRAHVRLHDVHGLAHDGVSEAPAGELVLA